MVQGGIGGEIEVRAAEDHGRHPGGWCQRWTTSGMTVAQPPTLQRAEDHLATTATRPNQTMYENGVSSNPELIIANPGDEDAQRTLVPEPVLALADRPDLGLSRARRGSARGVRHRAYWP